MPLFVREAPLPTPVLATGLAERTLLGCAAGRAPHLAQAIGDGHGRGDVSATPVRPRRGGPAGRPCRRPRGPPPGTPLVLGTATSRRARPYTCGRRTLRPTRARRARPTAVRPPPRRTARRRRPCPRPRTA